MFYLMCKDTIVAEFNLSEYGVDSVSVYENLPIGCERKRLYNWLKSRHASKHRKHLTRYLEERNCYTVEGFLRLTHGISINDGYWVKEVGEDIKWKDVSPYINDFDEIIQRLSFDGFSGFDSKLSTVTPEFGTSGVFDKCWKKEGEHIFLYKRGNSEGSNGSIEPYCEVLASQVFSKMRAGIPYQLVMLHGKVASKCKLFNSESISFATYLLVASTDYTLNGMLDYYSSIHSENLLRRVLICDAITINTDRHIGNHGVLYSCGTNEIIRMAPGFDYNLSMLPYANEDNFKDLYYYIHNQKPKFYSNFVETAKYLMTTDIRDDLRDLSGIELKLPFYSEEFPEERAAWMTDVINAQIDNILFDRDVFYTTIKADGLTNIARYKLKYKVSDDAFEKDKQRLMEVLHVVDDDLLEDAIVDLL